MSATTRHRSIALPLRAVAALVFAFTSLGCPSAPAPDEAAAHTTSRAAGETGASTREGASANAPAPSSSTSALDATRSPDARASEPDALEPERRPLDFARMDEADDSQAHDTERDALEAAALQRWQSLEPKRRAELEQRFRDLSELSPDERAELERKKRALDAEVELVQASLSSADRERLTVLSPHERRAVLRDLLFAAKRERGLLRRPHVPPHLLHELDDAPPHERRRILDEMRRRALDEGPGVALRKVGERLGIASAEIDRAQRLAPRDRLELLRSWRRKALARDIERNGLPPFVDATRWSELAKLDDASFWREFDRLRPPDPWRDGPARGAPTSERDHGHEPAREPVAAPRREPQRDRPPRDESRPHGRGGVVPPVAGSRFDGPRHDGLPHDGPPRDGLPPHRPPGADEPIERRDLDEQPALGGALRPSIQELIELRDLPPEERRRLLSDRMRERALHWLEQHGGLTSEQLEGLRARRGEPFFEQLRETLRARGPSRASEPRDVLR